MSEDNMELVRTALRPGQIDAVFELLDEDVVWDATRHAPLDLEGVHRGKEDVVHLFKRWIGAWTEYSFEVEELTEAGDSVVLAVKETGLGAGSGAPMEQHYFLVWTFEDQRIVRGATCKTKAEALEVAGLSE